MRYRLTPMFYRPYLLNDLSQKLIESHYENNYGGALRRLNAITEKLESLDFAKTPGYVINGRTPPCGEFMFQPELVVRGSTGGVVYGASAR